jgi:hypothetical protein
VLLAHVSLQVHSGIDLETRFGRNGRLGFNKRPANIAGPILLAQMAIQQPHSGMNECRNNDKYSRRLDDGRKLYIRTLMLQFFNAPVVFHIALCG